jgi:hypothetical protein
VSATTIRYGHRGGWLSPLPARVATEDRPGTPADRVARATAWDPDLFAHPERIAQARAHSACDRGACAHDQDRTQPCDCEPAPAEVAALWAGRARMAAARAAAGQLPDDLDREALAHPKPGATPDD